MLEVLCDTPVGMGSADDDHGELDALLARVDELVVDRSYEAAARCCDALIDRYGHEEERYAVDRVAHAMAQQCWSLRRCGDGERLLAAVARLDDRFGDASDPWLIKCAARGTLEEVAWLVRSGDPDAALAASETLINRFEREHNSEVREALGETLFRTASQLAWGPGGWRQPLMVAMLALSPLSDAATSAYNRSVRAWIPATPAALRHVRASAPSVGLMTRSNSLRRRLDRALRIYDLLIAHFDSSEDPSLHKLAVGAKLNRGTMLSVLGRARMARSAWRDIYALTPTELAMITTTAHADPDGGYDSTATVAAIVSTVSSASERPSGSEVAAQTIRDTLKTDSIMGRIRAAALRLLE
jgi:hypothetical protein